MASLLVGGVIVLTDKIKLKKAAKREAKREAYEKRYKELEDEHQKTQRSPSGNPEMSQTGHDRGTQGSGPELERKTSRESLTDEDGPSRWVNEVALEKTKSQSGRS